MDPLYSIPTLPDELLRLKPQTRSTGFHGGRTLNASGPTQSGGAIIGGGISTGHSWGEAFNANFRGLWGGPGRRDVGGMS